MNKSKFSYNPGLYNYLHVFDRIKKPIIDILGVDEEEIKLESNLINDFGADSLDIVELAMAFEKEFGIYIPDEVIENVPISEFTVRKCVEIIKVREMVKK